MQPASIVVLAHIVEVDVTVPRPLVVRQPVEASHTQAQRGRPALLKRIRSTQLLIPIDRINGIDRINRINTIDRINRINRINTIDRTGATPRPGEVLLADGTPTTGHAAIERLFRPIRNHLPTTPMSIGWSRPCTDDLNENCGPSVSNEDSK